MSDPVTTPDTQAVAPDAGLVPAVETFSKEYVKDLRDEAARYRTEKNSAVDAAKVAAKTEWEAKVSTANEKVSKLETDLGDSWVLASKLYAAIDAGVPSDKIRSFVEVIKGTTDDEITASARSAKELFGGLRTNDPATDPTQGSGGGTPGLNSDLLLQAVKSAVGA